MKNLRSSLERQARELHGSARVLESASHRIQLLEYILGKIDTPKPMHALLGTSLGESID